MNEKSWNKITLDKVIVVGLIVLNTLFLVYWSILAYYSQLHFDDLHFLWKMREMSVFDYIKEVYFTQSGRFVGYAINGVVSIVIDKLGFHQFLALFYYAIGLGICWLVVKDVKLPLTKIALCMATVFIYNLYILTNIDFPVFFWLCAMSYYLFLPIACLLLKYVNMEQLNGWQWLTLLVLSVFIGGVNEVFTPVVLLLLFINAMYRWHSKEWNVKKTWAMPQVRRIVWVAVVLLVLWTIVVVAPGNYARMSDTSQFIHPRGLFGWLKAIVEAVGMFCYFMAFYIPYYMVVFWLGYYVGGKTNIVLPKSKAKIVLGLVVAFIVYLVVSSLPNVYLYGGFGIQRTYTHIVFALLLTVAALGFVIGIGCKTTNSDCCLIGGIVMLIVVMAINVVKDTPTARVYGKAVENRIEYLCGLRDEGQKETVELPSLPIPYTEDAKHLVLHLLGRESPMSVLYYISDTDTIPNDYEYHMKKVLDLDFDFFLAKEGNHNGECE